MATWQLVIFGVLVLLPIALLADFHPHRERLDSRGRPLQRGWEAQVEHEVHDDAHH